MVKSKELQKAQKEVTAIRRKLKVAQNRLYKAWDVARTAPLSEEVLNILEQKERHFRSIKRRLTGMEESLRALQEGTTEPVRVKPWKVERPTTESRLFAFVEA